MRTILAAAFFAGCMPVLTSPVVDDDADDDGLTDDQERELGTRVHQPDSDDDGYSDRDELFEGTDPLDATDVIYTGGWPYYFEKTELLGGDTFSLGRRIAEFQLTDQYGDTVDVWDFYSHDVPVLLRVSTYCGSIYPFEEPPLVRHALEDGTLREVTILPGSYASTLIDLVPDDATWLQDPEDEVNTFFGGAGEAFFVLLTPELRVDHVVAWEADDAMLDSLRAMLDE